MRVAVMTCLRDRLDYTKHCLATLHLHAGCRFDHYIVDQGSEDGTPEWFYDQPYKAYLSLNENIGICPALNMLLDKPLDASAYDVIVRWDNDCELLYPNTLKAVCEAANDTGWILAPKVLGLRQPPAEAEPVEFNGLRVAETTTLGGIFMAIPADLFSDWGYRYDETNPPYTGDEAICAWWRAQGGRCGYVKDFEVNHYERIDEQTERFPEYQSRKLAEMAL